MKMGFLFPGQGSQAVGMGQDLEARFPLVKDLFERANDLLNFDIRRICFHGPEKELRATRNAQAALFLHSLAVAKILRNEGYKPYISAGHSLGEYAAIVDAGGLSFEDGLRLVKIRGELMAEAGRLNPGKMAALIGLSLADVAEICAGVAPLGTVVIANINSEKQMVISGEAEPVNRAVELAKQAGAARTVLLPVSGAFHSPLMKEAAAKFADALNQAAFFKLETPVLGNVSARRLTDKTELKTELALQMISPVQWLASVGELVASGVEKFIEAGPGKVLKGLLLQFDRTLEVMPAGTVADLSKALEVLEKWKER